MLWTGSEISYVEIFKSSRKIPSIPMRSAILRMMLFEVVTTFSVMCLFRAHALNGMHRVCATRGWSYRRRLQGTACGLDRSHGIRRPLSYSRMGMRLHPLARFKPVAASVSRPEDQVPTSARANRCGRKTCPVHVVRRLEQFPR